MKIGPYEIKAPPSGTAFSLFKNGSSVTTLYFGSYEAACKIFTAYINNHGLDLTVTEPVKALPDSCNDTNFLEVSTNERTVGNYSNSGYLKLMGNV